MLQRERRSSRLIWRSPMHPKIPRNYLALIALLLLGILGWRLWPRRAPTQSHVIQASGSIEATEILISPKVGGRLITLAVDEGSVVRAGDLIAQIDTNELQAQLDAAGAARGHTNAQWEAARNGNRPEQIAQARAQLAQAQAAAAGTYAALLDTREDYNKVTELKAQVDAAKTHYDATLADRTQAQEALRLAREGSRKQQIEQSSAAVDQAQVELAHDESD